MIEFKLKPFTLNSLIQDFSGGLSVVNNLIELDLKLEGNLDQLQWPAPGPAPMREDNLWRETCFELFISHPGQAQYFELNFSTSGNWQSFSFSDYRKDKQISQGFQLVNSTMDRKPCTLNISIVVSYQLPASFADSFNLGPSAVLLDAQDKYHYYALQHDEKPDFHRKNSHLLTTGKSQIGNR